MAASKGVREANRIQNDQMIADREKGLSWGKIAVKYKLNGMHAPTNARNRVKYALQQRRRLNGGSMSYSFDIHVAREHKLEAEVRRLRAYIQSLDGKTICIRCEDDTFIDDGVVVAADVLNVGE